MLQSEFEERTKVYLKGEEYAKVEAIYNAVKMDKDEFCKYWLKHRNDKLFQEMAEAIRNKETALYQCDMTIKNMEGIIAEKNKFHEDEMQRQYKRQNEHLVGLMKKLLLCLYKDPEAQNVNAESVYDAIEEECGIAFIITTKRNAGIPLSDSEIDYMVSKL